MKQISRFSHKPAGAPQQLIPLALVFASLLAVNSWAAPSIIATNVTSQCAGPVLAGQPTPVTVFVQLDPLTSSFYGSGLVYYFTNTNTGQVLQYPGPVGNPADFPVPAGIYTLVIKTPPVIGQGQSASSSYNVTVNVCGPAGPIDPINFFQVCAPPPNGLKAWWTLDETTGNAHDLTGNLLMDGLRYGSPAV